MNMMNGGNERAQGNKGAHNSRELPSKLRRRHKHDKTKCKKWGKGAWFKRVEQQSSECTTSSDLAQPEREDHEGASASSSRPHEHASACSCKAMPGSTSSSDIEIYEGTECYRTKNSQRYPNSEVDEQNCLRPSMARAMFLQLESLTSPTKKTKRFSWPKKKQANSDKVSLGPDDSDCLIRTSSMPSGLASNDTLSNCHCPACCNCSPLERLQGSCPAFIRRFTSTTSLDTGLAELGCSLGYLSTPWLEEEDWKQDTGLGHMCRSPPRLPSPSDPCYPTWLIKGDDVASLGSHTDPHKTNSLPSYLSSRQRWCKICGKMIQSLLVSVPVVSKEADSEGNNPSRPQTPKNKEKEPLTKVHGSPKLLEMHKLTNFPYSATPIHTTYGTDDGNIPSAFCKSPPAYCQCKVSRRASGLNEGMEQSPCSVPRNLKSSPKIILSTAREDSELHLPWATSSETHHVSASEFKQKKNVSTHHAHAHE